MQIYGYVLDKITIVVGKSKALKVSGLIPKFWGLIVAKNELGKIVLIEIREPKLNRNININWLSKKLWRSDIVNILKAKNLYKGRSRYYRDGLLKILMENISLSELRHHIRNVLINRIY